MVYSGIQQGAQPQYMQAPGMQSAGQFRGPVQQLPGHYTIPPQQLPYQQLPSTGFTGMRQGRDVYVRQKKISCTTYSGSGALMHDRVTGY